MSDFLCEIVLVRPSFLTDGTPQEYAAVQAHFDRLQRDQVAGIVYLAGRTQTENPRGLIIFKAEDMPAAQRYIDEDPAIVGGVMRVIALEPYSVAVFPGLD